MPREFLFRAQPGESRRAYTFVPSLFPLRAPVGFFATLLDLDRNLIWVFLACLQRKGAKALRKVADMARLATDLLVICALAALCVGERGGVSPPVRDSLIISALAPLHPCAFAL